ncbi:hypothetical protein GCM10029978_077960 [Actinoallomurus acanthiterrae]
MLIEGMSASSWWTAMMPARRASSGPAAQRLAVPAQPPGLRAVDARQDLDERGLARAVLTGQGVDLAARERE